MYIANNPLLRIKIECLVAFAHSRIIGLAGKGQEGVDVFKNRFVQKATVSRGKEIDEAVKDLATVDYINSQISKQGFALSNMYHYHYSKARKLLDKAIPKDGEMIEGLIGLHLMVGLIEKGYLNNKDESLLEYFKETIEMYENENYTSCEKVKETVKFMKEVSRNVFNQYWEKPKRKLNKRK